MIGLGSNRLSVCRRGGMSVTQAGKGGMEWLAGGRVPRWAQWWLPYSRQAGEALKAQFPTQWPTIRDYGFAHPALVPFINEDPMLVMSLIEGLGERWLVGDGNPYIKTGIVPTTNTVSEILFKDVVSTSYRSYIGRGDNWNTSDHYAISTTNGTTLGVYMAGTDCAPRYSVARTDIIHAYNIRVSGFSYDNITKGTTTNYSTGKTTLAAGSGRDLWIFRDNTVDGNLKLGTAVSIAYCKIDDKHFVPCRHNGENGMLEVTNAVFYQNAGSGSFTISETPAA